MGGGGGGGGGSQYPLYKPSGWILTLYYHILDVVDQLVLG